MTDQELAEKIAKALLTVEEIEGVELLECKLRLNGSAGFGIVNFAPDAWRNHRNGPRGPKAYLRMMFTRPNKENIAKYRHYVLKGIY